MIRRIAATAAAVVLLGSCGGGASSDERQVLVDFSYDDFATAIFKNFPEKVEITPGQTVVFKQTWTGEPHTITGGAAYNEDLLSGKNWLDFFTQFEELLVENADDMINPEDPGDATVADFAESIRDAKPQAKSREILATYRALRAEHPSLPDLDNPSEEPFSVLNDAIDTESGAAFENIQFAFDDEDNLAQNLGQPCYLRSGEPPEDPGTACTDAQQRQPVFDGTHSVYNSGILRYEGPRGNNFPIEFADDTKPGSYLFYCAVHGPSQITEVVVRPEGTDIPSATEVARAARDRARSASKPMQDAYRDATRTGTVEVDGEEIEGPFAGIPTEVHGIINEFVPRTIRAKVDEPIEWKIMGADHTISFDVPPYLPIIEFGSRFRINPKVENRAGGSPEVPEQDGEGAVEVDAGTYDGEGFFSSGLIGAEPYLAYKLRISKPGTYNYACLIHPHMVGKVIVS